VPRQNARFWAPSVMTSLTKTRDFAAEHADELLSRLILQIGRCVKSRTPETVHDLRVAIRRLTQALIVFKACFSPKELKKVRRGLKKVLSAAGRVRNGDIAVELLTKFEQDDLDAVLKKVKQDRRQAKQNLGRLLKRRMDAKWRNRLLTRSDAGKRGFESVGETAQRIFPRLTKAFFERGNRAARKESSAAELHRFRLATKKFRYTLELFEALYGPALEPALEQLRAVQSLLGDVSDCETVREMVAREGGHREVEARLRKRCRGKIQAFRRLWQQQFGGPDSRRQWVERLVRFNIPKKSASRTIPAPAVRSAVA
jgi:CHAD domain-containing protein